MSVPHDYVAFTALALALFAASQLMARSAGPRVRLRAFTGAAVALVLLVGWPVTLSAGRRARANLVEMLTGYAPTYAAEMEVMGHARVNRFTPADDPDYLRMIEAEKRWLRANPSISDVYTFRHDAGDSLRLIVDSETDYDRNGRYEGDLESRTGIGEVYPESDATLEEAFRGVSGFDPDTTRDRWGTWVSAFAPIHDALGSICGVLGVDFDASQWGAVISRARFAAMGYLLLLVILISGGGAAAAILVHHRDLARAGSRSKSEFLAMMSHEIRTPMNGVSGMATLILETPLTAEQREFAVTIKSSADALRVILDDILDFSKIEAGHLELEQAPVDLGQLCADVTTLLSPRAVEKGLVLELRIADAPLRPVLGDALRLRQVLVNLVGNAIKFTERGHVHLLAECVDDSPGVRRVRLSVADTGIGIAPEAQARIFEQFRQADGSTTRRFGGTGLGLAISRRIVERMGGDLRLESEPGRGSTFSFELRLPATGCRPVVASAEAAPAAGGPPGLGLHVLVVDDIATNSRVAGHMLRRLGCTFDVADGGAAALTRFTGRRYDLVFMDCQMPDLDGFETTRELRRREAGGARTPVVAMTANAMAGDRERCLDAGMDDYLTKPIQPAQVAAVLQKWCPAAARTAA